jgi:multidrug efflux pump subunit AcrA (membrane-fusion protein)
LNTLRANVFQKLLAKYRTGKAQYQDLKKELEKLSGELGLPYFENTAAVLPALIPPLSDSASLVASLESQLADSVPAATAKSLKRKHAEELQGLQAQASRAQELEADLAKAREAEASLQLEFDRRLAEEKRILSAEFENKVTELRATLEGEAERRGAQISELETLRKLDGERHDTEIGIWHARDRKVQSGLLGLEEALHGNLSFPLLSSCPFAPPPYSLIAFAGAFPDSDEAAMVALKEYRADQKIVPSSDPTAELTSGELVALAKGRLHPVAQLSKDLREAITSIFETLWPGMAVPDEIQALL